MGRLTTLDEWLDWQQKLHTSEIDLGLERIAKVYANIFNNKPLPFAVITIAGTNGKGSTAAFIENVYHCAGYKVAKFSSPHIIKYNERFNINTSQVNDDEICAAFAIIEQHRDDISLTYFEFSTLAALIIFNAAKVDIAILEVGLGGRLDSVNVVEPDVSVITNIDIDHTQYLGTTREQIGLEKAHIMRSNKPCVCADINPPKSLIAYAKNIGASVNFIATPYMEELGLSGEHQRMNAALAIAAIAALNQELDDKFNVDMTQIKTALKTTKLNARLQHIAINNKTIIIDAAHNELAATALAKYLAQENITTIAIFAALADKDISAMIKKMQAVIDKWFLVPINADRAISSPELVKMFGENSDITSFNNIKDAINTAVYQQDAQRIIIFGSFYTVADATNIIDSIT